MTAPTIAEALRLLDDALVAAFQAGSSDGMRSYGALPDADIDRRQLETQNAICTYLTQLLQQQEAEKVETAKEYIEAMTTMRAQIAQLQAAHPPVQPTEPWIQEALRRALVHGDWRAHQNDAQAAASIAYLEAHLRSKG